MGGRAALSGCEETGGAVKGPGTRSPSKAETPWDIIAPGNMSDTAVYLYCVVHRDAPPRLTRLAGVPEGSPPAVDRAAGSFWVLWSEVPMSAYGAGAIESRLRDVAWVGEVALAHEAVVARAAGLAGATAIPMKLFTMFSNRDKAVGEVRRRRTELTALVRRIRGCAEWGVRIVRANGRVIESESTPASSGTAFLAARRDARDRARQHAVRSAEAAVDAYRLLERAARRATRRPAPDEATAPPLLDAAFLVPRARTAAFKGQVRRAGALCASAGAQLTLTGPWPAYSFLDPSLTP